MPTHISAEIVADSINDLGERLTTFALTYPRYIHGEVMTHRKFSRNASSSRAVPIKKSLQQVRDRPVIPETLYQNQRGMQGGSALDDAAFNLAEDLIHRMGRYVADGVEALDNRAHVHKQHGNRYLEPWLTITTLVTATDYRQFFKQRCHPDAQPEMQELAYLMRAAYDENTPARLGMGAWHMPYVGKKDIEEIGNWLMSMRRSLGEVGDVARSVSIARCARVSYLNHEGTRDISKDVGLHNDLASNGHWSPFEHVATPMPGIRCANFQGWYQARKLYPGEDADA